jgi:hypothetical protein
MLQIPMLHIHRDISVSVNIPCTVLQVIPTTISATAHPATDPNPDASHYISSGNLLQLITGAAEASSIAVNRCFSPSAMWL